MADELLLMETGFAASEDRRRRAILRAARASFMTAGFAATRMEPLAREANVSTATLYSYFGSKSVLFEAVIRDVAEDFIQRMDKVRGASGPAREQLTVFMTAYASAQFRWLQTLALAAVATIFCALVFVKGLGVPLPLIGRWLGG